MTEYNKLKWLSLKAIDTRISFAGDENVWIEHGFLAKKQFPSVQ